MIYEINIENFEPKDIFECGQCFRWNKEKNNSYTGVFNNSVLNVEKKNEKIIFKGIFDSKEQIDYYFDLNRDYSEIIKKLSLIDKNVKESVDYGEGIRILNQDLWETIISFIISANNNIPRIKGIIERLSKNYGTKIKIPEEMKNSEFFNKDFYSFPTPEQLSQASIQDLRNVGLGFRDIRVYETTRKILNKEIDIDILNSCSTQEAREKLLLLDGVGPKVADCILLFSSLKRFDVFPIDVWVRRVMNELYIHNPEEAKVNKKEIQKIADEKFGNLQGIAQQYLFYYRREA